MVAGEADYAKGNRFAWPGVARVMPPSRLLGNVALSLLTRVATGYSTMFDSQCGYTAANRRALHYLGLELLYHAAGEWGDSESGRLVSAQLERKRRALLAHATQMGPETFFMKIPELIFNVIFGLETFQLVKSLEPVPEQENDLFAGLR